MDDEEKWWIGTGATPRAAVKDLAPDLERDDVAWIEGLHDFSDRADPADYHEDIERNIVIIYESEPVIRWRVIVEPAEPVWRAYFIGAKKDLSNL